MKKFVSLILSVLMVCTLLVGCGDKTETWTVTCPWAPSGVAAMVSQKAAALSTEYSEDIILVGIVAPAQSDFHPL